MVVLVLLRGLQVLVAHLALGEVVVEVALVARRRPRVDLDDDVRQRPQEVAVVRDEHERAVVGLQELLQPLDGRQVEVVRRLVQQQEVGLRREDARELRAHTPATGERLERLGEVLGREAEAAERDLHARLDVVAAQMLELRLKLAVAPHLHGIREVGLQRLHLCLHLREAGDAAQGIVEQRLLGRVGRRVLPREADARARLDDEFARVRRHLAEDDLEERRLARTVRADDADAIALVDAERDVRQDVLMSVMDGDSPEVQHLRVSNGARATRAPPPVISSGRAR